jgi:anti-anti-sigma factor
VPDGALALSRAAIALFPPTFQRFPCSCSIEREIMRFVKTEIGETVYVEVDGHFIGGYEYSENFYRFVRSLIDEGHRSIVLDLGGSHWASSHAIGMLVSARTSVVRAGGDLALTGLRDRVHETLRIMGLLRVFTTFESPADAVREMSRRSANG